MNVVVHDLPYPVILGSGLLNDAACLLPLIKGRQVLIITQAPVAQHYLNALLDVFSSMQCDVHYLPCGEQHKNFNEWQKIFDTLLEKNHDRTTTLIALGGGMVGDMTGFAAACYQRGAAYIQIPTTLMAQVDSAVGGKCAINHANGKNMIGVFYHPISVLIDIAVLNTLPEQEYRSGIAEIIKYALIADKAFFVWLENNASRLAGRDSQALIYAIQHSIKIKACIVAQDEKDHGLRQVLNFGHTFGHALETACHYKILHGEAVAAGMKFAAHFSEKRKLITGEELARILKLINYFGFSTPTSIRPSELLSFMRRDKKNQHGNMTLILLKGIGEAVIEKRVDSLYLQQFLSTLEVTSRVE